MAPSSTRTAAAEARVRTVRLFVDGPGKRVLFAEASEGAAAFLFALLAAVGGLLRKDPASAAAGCFGNLAAAEALLPGGPSSTASSRAPPPASPAPKGMGIMGRRMFRCGHLGCRCSDVASREAGSACPCAFPSCSRASANGGGASGRRDTELHFLEACLYRRPDGSAAAALGRGAGRSGNAFYSCRARDERHGREIVECRFRVTDERGVECPLCGSHTTVAVTCAKAGDGEDSSVSARPDAGGGGEAAGPPTTTSYAIMDDLVVRPIAGGLSGVAADPDDVREETVPFGYEEGRNLLSASLRSKTALTDVFLPVVDRAGRRRRH